MSHMPFPCIWSRVFIAYASGFSLVKQQKRNGCMKATQKTNGNGFNN